MWASGSLIQLVIISEYVHARPDDSDSSLAVVLSKITDEFRNINDRLDSLTNKEQGFGGMFTAKPRACRKHVFRFSQV